MEKHTLFYNPSRKPQVYGALLLSGIQSHDTKILRNPSNKPITNKSACVQPQRWWIIIIYLFRLEGNSSVAARKISVPIDSAAHIQCFELSWWASPCILYSEWAKNEQWARTSLITLKHPLTGYNTNWVLPGGLFLTYWHWHRLHYGSLLDSCGRELTLFRSHQIT